MWHCINRMKELDKPRKWPDTLQSLCQSAPILINIPDYYFTGLSQEAKKHTQQSISYVNLLQRVWLSPLLWSSVFFCGFKVHVLWEDGVSEPHLLHYFSYQAFLFLPCSHTSYTHLITFQLLQSSSQDFFLPLLGPWGVSAKAIFLILAMAAASLDIGLVVSEEFWYPSFEACFAALLA